MDKNRIDGAAKEIKGSVKEAVSKLTGDKTGQVAGAAEKAVGKVQRKTGEALDKARDAKH